MKKMLAMLMILLLTVGTVFAGFDPHGDYTLNTSARMLKGTSEGEEVTEVDYMVQLKYSYGLEVDGHGLPDVDDLLNLMVESENPGDYEGLEDAIEGLFGTSNYGYVKLQNHYYTTSSAITTTPGALALSYPKGEPPTPDGLYKHGVTFKIVLVDVEVEPDEFEKMWKVLQVTHDRYYYDEEWIKENVFSYKSDELYPPAGLGKYKGDKINNPPKGSGENNGKKDSPPGNAYGRTKVKNQRASSNNKGNAKGKNK